MADEEQSWDDVQGRRDAHKRRFGNLSPSERAELRRAHYMHCPKCGADLEEVVFRAVRVDKCFGCGGVWLDDGELEELAGQHGWFEALRRFFRGD
jgi:hypothetical protein